MRSKVRFAWLFGSVVLVTAGALGAGACSSSSDTTPLPSTGTDSGSQTDGTAPKGDSSTGPGTDSGNGGGTDAGSPDCGKIPSLHTPGTGPFCPFQDPNLDASSDCPANQSCCQYQGAQPTPDSVCSTPAACPAQTGFPTFETQCDGPTQCGAGSVCCMYTASQYIEAGVDHVEVLQDTSEPTSCTQDLKAKYAGGTKCEVGTTCGASEIIICNVSGTDCPAGKTCTAFATNAKDLGYCL